MWEAGKAGWVSRGERERYRTDFAEFLSITDFSKDCVPVIGASAGWVMMGPGVMGACNSFIDTLAQGATPEQGPNDANYKQAPGTQVMNA